MTIRVAAAFPDGTALPNGYAIPFIALDAALLESAVGVLEIEIPTEYVPEGLGRDYQLRIYRTLYGSYEQLEGDAVWLIRGRELTATSDGLETTTFVAQHINSIVDRRVIAYGAGTTQSRKEAPFDDIIKELVRENFITATNADRNVTILSVDADVSAAPNGLVQVSYQPLGQTIRDICQASRDAGTYLGYEIRESGLGFRFLTFIGQRGVDRRFGTGSALLFGREFRNVSSITVNENWEDAATVAYAAAPGEGRLRPVVTAQIAADELGSPFGRIELLVSGSGRSTAELAYDASSTISQARGSVSMEAETVDSSECIYGRDYFWGDRATVVESGVYYDVIVDPVRISATLSGGAYDVSVQSKLTYKG